MADYSVDSIKIFRYYDAQNVPIAKNCRDSCSYYRLSSVDCTFYTLHTQFTIIVLTIGISNSIVRI